MNAARQELRKLLRGPAVSRLLARCGIDAKRYWLLMDLFATLSRRGETTDQLGHNKRALRKTFWVLIVLSTFMSLFLVFAADEAGYLATSLFLTAFLLLSTLLSETANSLVNPTEGLVLAHQPIDGATYTAAKLSHLARIVLVVVLSLNAIPALAGLLLKGTRWWYPFLHMAAALAVGAATALVCSALFGWLIRLVPLRRLKAAGEFAASLPFLAMIWRRQMLALAARIDILHWLPAPGAGRWAVEACIAIIAVVVAAFGIRSLSADYLLRVSGLMRGGASAGSRVRRSVAGLLVSRCFGGQTARAGFAFVSRMMLRDWQFRRQLVPMLFYTLAGFGSAVVGGWPRDPFARGFAPAHLLPHIFGMMLFFVCAAMPYGNDYKGAWVFALAPAAAFHGFARGIHALLWIGILLPQTILLPVLAWRWGFAHAALFIAWSMAVSSCYLALELKTLHEIPFSRQMDPSRGTMLLPLMMLGGAAMAAAVAVQYFLVFHSESTVAIATVAAAAMAWLMTQSSVNGLAASMRAGERAA